MSEKERDMELEDILKEFAEKPEKTAAQAQPQADETDAMQDAAFVEWLKGDEPEEAPAEEEALPDLEATRRMDAVDLEATRRIESVDLEVTRRMEPVTPAETDREVTGDTIRLDGLLDSVAGHREKPAQTEEPEDARIWNPAETIRSEPFSDRWEPEYEQPMGEYIPPQPIQFHPRSRLRELKRKLVAGPEKRYYELSEKGVGKLQAAIFFSLLVVLISAVSTVMYGFGMVHENRMRLMVFSQFLALLVSALLGSNQLIEGLAALLRKKFTLNTLLVVSFVVCCLDGILCLKQVRVPCCAAFSLQMTMSLWSAYHRRNTEISRMDTMRKAIRLDGVAACPAYMDGKKGLLRKEGQVEDFMDHYAETGKPETRLNTYALVAGCVALAIGIAAGVLEGLSAGVAAGVAAGVQVTAVSLLAAVPASAFVCQSRPAWVLERRLHKLGTVLCGWQGVEGLSGKAVFPVTYGDLYPADAVRLNGVKFFGAWEPELVVAYATAVITAEESGLTGVFHQVLDSYSGRHYDAYNLTHYDNGGVCGVVEGETVLIGSASFLKDMDIEVPENAKVKNGVYVAISGELSGLFAVSYEKTQSAAAGISTLTSYRKLQCVMTSDDFMLTHRFMQSKFGVKPKRFCLPNHDVRAQLRQTELEEDAQTLLMTTATGLAPIAYGVTGARMLRITCRFGAVLHMVGGAIGLGIMALLVALGALELLTPANMFLYQLVWAIPAVLITEWTRSI